MAVPAPPAGAAPAVPAAPPEVPDIVLGSEKEGGGGTVDALSVGRDCARGGDGVLCCEGDDVEGSVVGVDICEGKSIGGTSMSCSTSPADEEREREETVLNESSESCDGTFGARCVRRARKRASGSGSPVSAGS